MYVDNTLFFFVLLEAGLFKHALAAGAAISIATLTIWALARLWRPSTTLGKVSKALLQTAGFLIAVVGIGLYLGALDFRASSEAHYREFTRCDPPKNQMYEALSHLEKPDRFRMALEVAARNPACKDLEKIALLQITNNPNEEFSPEDLDAALRVLRRLDPAVNVCSDQTGLYAASDVRQRGIASLSEAMDSQPETPGRCWGLKYYFSIFSQRCKGIWRGQCGALPRARLESLRSDEIFGLEIRDLMRTVWGE